MNGIMKALKIINEEEKNQDCQWILFVDELLADQGSDFRSLCILEDVDVLIGVSPNFMGMGFGYFRIIPPENKMIIAKRLVFKHRNSLELNVFLAHLNIYSAKEFGMSQPLSDDENMPLIDSCFPAVDKVLKYLKVRL